MKRSAVLGIVLLSLIGGVLHASAAPAKPVAVTHFLHGTNNIGEVQNFTDGYGTMDTKAPTGTTARSSGITNYAAGPNTACAGNSLFPVWVGSINGAPVGNATVELFLDTVGSGSVEVRLYADVTEQACNADHPAPLGTETITLANGQKKATVTLKNLNRKAKQFTSLMLQVSPVVPAPPFSARIQYDSAATPSRVTFSCVPKAGKKTC